MKTTEMTIEPQEVICSTPELSTYLPVDSRVKPLQRSNFERQVLILLSTPPVIRDIYL
jgi:hypothetical protein